MSVEEMRLPSIDGERRGGSFNYKGFHRYLITMSVYKSSRVFVQEPTIRRVLDVLAASARKHQFDVYAYCFLPDQLVLIVRGKTGGADLKEFLMTFRQHSSAALSVQSESPLWKKKYIERVLRKKEITNEVARRIFQLPVKAGLAAKPENYPFQGSFVIDVK